MWIFFIVNKSNKYGKTLLHALKTAYKKIANKAAEATGEFIGNKITDKILKTKPVPDENLRDAEDITIPPKKRQKKY